MPWIVPSHPAPVLPLKRWKPAWFSGLALVLGTVAPDLVFILRLDERGSPASHSFLGQLYLTVPLVLALHALATRLVLPWLVPHLPAGWPFHPQVLARCRPALDAPALLRVAVSGLVGGLSHVFLDGFTHGNHAGWALAFVPALATPVPHLGGVAPLHDALQLWLTIVLGGLALHEWDRMARALPSAPPAPDGAGVRARGTSGRVRLGLTVAAILGAVLAPVLKHAPSPEVVLELAAYGALTFATGAAVLAALAHRVRVLLDRQRLETDRALES